MANFFSGIFSADFGGTAHQDFTSCSLAEEAIEQLKEHEESNFVGVEGATSLKAEIVGRVPDISTAAHYRQARKLLQELGGADALKEELAYSGFVDIVTDQLTVQDKPSNFFALCASGKLAQPSAAKDQAALGGYKDSFMIVSNRHENDINWDSSDPRWIKRSSMAIRHRFLTTKDLHWQWFNPLIFGLVSEEDGGVNARKALAEVERMKAASLQYAKNIGGWTDKIGLFVNVFGHNNVNSLFVHILDMSDLGPSFSLHGFKNCPLDDIIKVLREEAVNNLLPAAVSTGGGIPGVKAKARTRTSSVYGKNAKFFFAGTDGATSVKAEVVGRLPLIKDAASFRGARRMVTEELGGTGTLKEELLRSGFIDPLGNLTTGTRPFNIFARVAAGVMQQPGMDKEQEYLGEFQEYFMVCSNRPENDEHWDSDDKEWVGKASMSKRHRFITSKDLHWQWFNALVFGLVPESKGGAGRGKAIDLVQAMRDAAFHYTKHAPGWSRKVGMFFHVFGHNSVNSLHLHVLDMECVGPTFWHYEYKNCPLDVVLKVLQEESSTSSESALVDVTEAAVVAAKAATAAAEALTRSSTHSTGSRIRRHEDIKDGDVLTVNVGGEVQTVCRATMLMAPDGSLLKEIFSEANDMLLAMDDDRRPFLDFPSAAFRLIADHMKLLQLTPSGHRLSPLRPPAAERQQVEQLAWILGVDDLVLRGSQVGRGKDRTLPPRRASREAACAVQ